MTDINQRVTRRPSRNESDGQSEGASRGRENAPDPSLFDVAELLFFAYRDFIREPDEILAEFGFGRAHHRVLHFVSRYPGLRVADLLVILQITKQSLGRVLKQLVDEGYIAQRAGESDRRERLLHPTPEGKALAERLAMPQIERIAEALGDGPQTAEAVRAFLFQMISDADRPIVKDLLASARRDRKDG